jgi:hypothetical protein
MKCATDRLKDKDDVRKIMEIRKINWDTVVEEIKVQITLGKDKAAFELGEFLEHLKEKMNLNIPQDIIDTLWGIVQKQAEEKQRK